MSVIGEIGLIVTDVLFEYFRLRMAQAQGQDVPDETLARVKATTQTLLGEMESLVAALPTDKPKKE